MGIVGLLSALGPQELSFKLYFTIVRTKSLLSLKMAGSLASPRSEGVKETCRNLPPGDKAGRGTSHRHPLTRWGDLLLCTGPRTAPAFQLLLWMVSEWKTEKNRALWSIRQG